MRSPFAIFRKHQRMAMAILTGLSMFAFVVMDQLRAESPMTFPILAAAAGMVLFGIWGYRRGEPMTWAVAGGALGVAIAVVGMRFAPAGSKPPVQTAMGDISHEELQKLMERRHVANNFLQQAFTKVSPPLSNNPMFMQYYEQQLQGILFNFGSGNGDDVANDVIMGFLLDKEADDLGISVSDGTVSDYINKVTNHKLSPAEYTEILKSLRLTDGQVYDAIRAELRARLAMEMLVPRATPTQEQFWDDYRKLQVTQALDVAAVPVSDFLAEAPQPTDEDVRKYYNTWKSFPPAAPGAPGLFQPRRARIEFLTADFAEIEKQVEAKPVSDAEVKKYYEDHRQDYRNRPAAGSSTLNPVVDPNLPNLLSDPALSVPEAPSLPAPLVPQGPAAKQPTAPSLPAESPAPATKTPAVPPSGGPKSTPAPKKGDGTSKSGANNDRPSRALGLDGEMLALADEPIGRTLQVAYQPAPTEKSTAKAGANSDAAQAADKKGPSVGGDKSKSPSTPVITPKTPAAAQGPREPKAPALPRNGGSAKSETEPEFRPLDDLLQREIRETISRNRTLEIMKARIQGAYDYMNKLRDKVIPAEVGSTPAMNAEQRAKALTEYASQHGVKYGITPPMSFLELRDASEKYPIAVATEPLDNPFQNREPVSVLQEVFGTPLEALFSPAQADDHDAHRFAFWKVEDVDGHIPSLEESGVRDAAIRGWKIETFAQKHADTRAKELAESCAKVDQAAERVPRRPDRDEAAEGAGRRRDSHASILVVHGQLGCAQGLMQQTMPKLSDIAGVKSPDEAFMKTIFDEMKVGDVKAVPNFGASVYYVVRVRTRHPENAEEMAAFRARFMKENFYGSFFGHSTYEYLNAPPEQQLLSDWVERLRLKYNVKRNADEGPVRQTRSRRRTG